MAAAASLLVACYLPANSGDTAAPSQAAYQAEPSESEAETTQNESQPGPYYSQPEPYRPVPQYRGSYGAHGDRHQGQAECKSEYGTTACGYHCIGSYGTVRCAKTPAGACGSAYGEVTCWDPPYTDSRYPFMAAECMTAYGKIECGYGCAKAYGDVKCATRPGGVCTARYGDITCVE